MIKQIFAFGLVALMCSCQNNKMELSPNAVSIPITGNTYVTAGKEYANVSPEGIQAWTSPESVLSSWFKISHPGELNLYIKANAAEGASTLQISLEGKKFIVKVSDTQDTIIPVGKIPIGQPGYIRIDIQGIEKEGAQFANLTELLIDGTAATEPLNFIRDFEPYWGMRGPSVHLQYTLPQESVEYFYNEITVPEDNDLIGSYFMTNGFGEGYCGIQVNSDTDRRILFSVWSPFNTDDPEDIPEHQRIKLLAKGKDVHIGEFGNEGSGGQSYLNYPWKAGNTYRLITRVHPDGKGNTAYYAWFFDTINNQWRLIAGFLRPETNTWYTGAHSFLENFIPEQGYLKRCVHFGNQWARTAKGEWKEVTESTFTYDNTARAQVRVDYAGGQKEDYFFLRNGGFFNDNTEFKSIFTRPANGQVPDVDVNKLPYQE